VEYEDLIKRIPDGSSVTEPVCGRFGILIPDMDENENYDPQQIDDEERMLSEEILRLLDSEELLKEYSERSYERALEFTPERYKDSIHEILQRYE
jgi:hypothetical protein